MGFTLISTTIMSSCGHIRFRAFSDMQETLQDNQVRAPPPPVPPTRSSELRQLYERYVHWVERDHADLAPDTRKLLCMAKFMWELDAANYLMSNRQQVCLAMLIDGKMCRYENGAWCMQPALPVEGWAVLIALEGFFVTLVERLQEEQSNIEWN